MNFGTTHPVLCKEVLYTWVATPNAISKTFSFDPNLINETQKVSHCINTSHERYLSLMDTGSAIVNR